MLSFKAYLSRWMAQTTKAAPFTTDTIMAALRTSAAAAALQCSGGTNGRTCGLKWTDGAAWDGTQGVGQQMAALEVIISTQIESVAPPVTNLTGGTSKGNANAGSNSVGTAKGLNDHPTTGSDRTGAGILTALMLIGLLGGCAWLIFD
jgi:mannan endo-1,6-alpha-mannosidase